MKINIKKYFIITILTLSLPTYVIATTPPIPSDEVEFQNIQSGYMNMVEIGPVNVKVTTPVEVELDRTYLQENSAVVYDLSDKKFSSNLIIYSKEEPNMPISIIDVQTGKNISSLYDYVGDSTNDFYLDSNGEGFVELEVDYTKPITSNSLGFILDTYVALPTSVTISYLNESGNKVVLLNDYKPQTERINFPKTKTKKFFVSFKYSQPIRLRELQFNDVIQPLLQFAKLRFLAKPEHSYIVLLNFYAGGWFQTDEVPDLRSDIGVVNLGKREIKKNPSYVVPDSDKDGFIDQLDNCVGIANPDQADVDKNGRGDACDDFDRDSINNSKDNCVNDPNINQADTDGDDIGDICDDQESRITEKYPILVWGGIIFAALIFIILYFLAMKSIREKNITEEQNKNDNKREL